MKDWDDMTHKERMDWLAGEKKRNTLHLDGEEVRRCAGLPGDRPDRGLTRVHAHNTKQGEKDDGNERTDQQSAVGTRQNG